MNFVLPLSMEWINLLGSAVPIERNEIEFTCDEDVEKKDEFSPRLYVMM